MTEHTPQERIFQRLTDEATIAAHLDRGTQPQTGQRYWGGLEWAIARVLNLTHVADDPYRKRPVASAQVVVVKNPVAPPIRQHLLQVGVKAMLKMSEDLKKDGQPPEKAIGRMTLPDGTMAYGVGVYRESEGRWITTVVFRNKFKAWLFHVLLNSSQTHVGSRYV